MFRRGPKCFTANTTVFIIRCHYSQHPFKDTLGKKTTSYRNKGCFFANRRKIWNDREIDYVM